MAKGAPGKKKFLIIFVLLVMALLVGAAALIFAATSDIEVTWKAANGVEALEGNKNLQRFEEARNAGRRGFVPLTEIQINSIIADSYFGKGKEQGTNMVKKAGASLSFSNLTFVTWSKKNFPLYSPTFAWQRTIDIESVRGTNVPITAMKVGLLPIPTQARPKVEEQLAGGDSLFADRLKWLANVPAMRIVSNEVNHLPELRLYTYVPTNSPSK